MTLRNAQRRKLTSGTNGRTNPSIEVDGVPYYSAADVARELGISRQSLWKWRLQGKIPQGHRYRDRRVVFSAAELHAVREYAHRLEPAAIGAGAPTVNAVSGAVSESEEENGRNT